MDETHCYLGSHTTNVDGVDDGQLSPLREDVVDDGQPSRPPKAWRWRNIMLEVFSVKIINVRGEYPVHLYGEIKVVERMNFKEYIYNRNRENPESLITGDFVSLTGPTRGLQINDSFRIIVTLKNEYDNRLFNGEAIRKWIGWYTLEKNEEDKVFSEELRGLFGAVILNYVVLSDAVAATLEITLVKVEEENPANLYGKLTARNSDFMDEIAESVLFRKTLDADIIVKPGQLIPLSKSIVAVPVDSSLIIEASLFDPFYDEIAKGTAEFPAQLSGTCEKNIFGKYGEIKVNVTWVLR